ncbi:MAG TPA: acyltransferase [Geminicoccaceae bacterium]|nr:acyltransferase [Geminicoccaceae bacterium]
MPLQRSRAGSASGRACPGDRSWLSPELSTFLDQIRWLAAFLVLVFHLRLHTIGDYGSDVAGAQTLPVQAFFFLTGLGHQAVIGFFVLSGVLIAGRFVVRPPRTLGEHGEYLLDRLTRIWIVAVPALLFSALVAHLSQRAFGDFETSFEPHCTPGATDLIANLLFLHKAFWPILCSDSPYWSIHNEVWYYLLLPATVLAVAAPRLWLRSAMLALVAAAVGALLLFDPWDDKNTLAYLPVWLAGALLAAGWRWPLPPALAALLLLLSLIVAKTGHGSEFLIRDYLVALALLGLLLAVQSRGLPRWFVSPGLVASGRRLAGFSYSLYLTHAPVIYLLRTALHRGYGVALPIRAVTLPALAIMLLEGLIALALAWLFHLAFERHTNALRAAIRARLGRRSGLVRATSGP